ncbi:MAG: hypothetical protein ABI673_09540 [Novosphingobium sp.]
MRKVEWTLAMAGALVLSVVQASAEEAKVAPPLPKEPSLYVQCDGMPDNMSGGESAVRLLALSAWHGPRRRLPG